MKAKEAANFYLAKHKIKPFPTKAQKLESIYGEFTNDMKRVIKARQAKTEENYHSIIMEAHGKWKAFAKRVNAKEKGAIDPNGFLTMIKQKSDDVNRMMAKRGM